MEIGIRHPFRIKLGYIVGRIVEMDSLRYFANGGRCSARRLCYAIGLAFSFSLLLLLGYSSVKELKTKPFARQDDICTRKTKIALVKVHKAASTTLTSILQRYGMTNDLTFALPLKGEYHIGFFETLHPRNLWPVPKDTSYEILCQHVVYNREAFKKYLPQDVSVIASVREPVSRFVSCFEYFEEYHKTLLNRSHVKNDPVELMREYLTRPTFYEPERFKKGSLAVNRMSFDFGIPKDQYENASFVDDYLEMLDRNLEFVLVAEHFDESLVILKRRLCWTTKDILYKPKHKGVGKKLLIPDDVKKRLMELSPSDYQIYDYFSKKFQRIAASEVGLALEVKSFKITQRRVSMFCDQLKNTKAPDTMEIKKSRFSDAFNVSRKDCAHLSLGEVEIVRYLKRKQINTLRTQTFKQRLRTP